MGSKTPWNVNSTKMKWVFMSQLKWETSTSIRVNLNRATVDGSKSQTTTWDGAHTRRKKW